MEVLYVTSCLNGRGFNWGEDFMDCLYHVDLVEQTDDLRIFDYHTHTECEICYMTEGSQILYFKDEEIKLDKGSLTFINSNVPHRSVSMGGPFEYLSVKFHQKLVSRWLRALPEGRLSVLFDRDFLMLVPESMDQDFVSKIMKILYQTYNGNMLDVFELKLMELVVYMRMKGKHIASGRTRKISTAKRSHFEQITAYMEAQAFQVTVDEISEKFFLSRYYLFHMFKEVSGTTMKEYMDRNRMALAMEMIEHTDDPIRKIAENFGFDSLSNFGKVFKKYAGVSPTEYRKRIKGRTE